MKTPAVKHTRVERARVARPMNRRRHLAVGPSTMARGLWLLLALVPFAARAEAPPVPEWTKDELKTLFTRVEFAGRQETMEAQDLEMARTMGSAYRVLPGAAESTDGYARRVLKKVEPGHPDVKAGQWTLALARRFYRDTGQRAEILARIEANKADRQLLEARAQQSKAAVDQIASMLVAKLETGNLVAPVPTAKGDVPQSFGCEAYVRGEKVEINQLDRMTFTDHQPPPDARRTPKGALRELMASMKDFNMRAQTMGMIDPAMKQSFRKLRVFLPGTHPAIYLNELARAADEGGMSIIFFMVLDPDDGKLREIPLHLAAPKAPSKKKKAAPPPVKLSCADADALQACARKLAEARADGAALVYVAP